MSIKIKPTQEQIEKEQEEKHKQQLEVNAQRGLKDVIDMANLIPGSAVAKTALGIAGLMAADTTKSAGNLSSNSGELGSFQPFIALIRNKDYTPNELESMEGIESNEYVYLGKLKGFTVVKVVHLEGITATDEELRLIDESLMKGVYL